MTGLAEALAAEAPMHSVLDELIESLDDDDRTALLAALRNPKVRKHTLSRIMGAQGLHCHPGTIERWRQREGVGA